MGTCETFDHTADLGLRIEADTLDDLFATAACGLFDVIVVNRTVVGESNVDAIELSADSAEELLAIWMGELIFRSETAHVLYGRFEVSVAKDGRSMSATAYGEPLDASKHQLDHEVKAVTRHGLSVRQDGVRWIAEVILDI